MDRNRLHCLPAGLLRLPDLRTLSASHNLVVAISSDLSCLRYGKQRIGKQLNFEIVLCL